MCEADRDGRDAGIVQLTDTDVTAELNHHHDDHHHHDYQIYHI